MKKAKVNWMQGRVSGRVRNDGSIHLSVTSLRQQTSARPKSVEESGADPEMLRRINERIPGPVDTLGFIGGAVAQLVPLQSMRLLPQPLMEKLFQKYGSFGPLVFLAMVRNTGAPAVWNAAEPSGGMTESKHLLAEQIGEGAELGVFRQDGWCGFLLPPECHEHQNAFDKEQAFWWNIVRPGFPHRYDAPLVIMPVGRDTRNGMRGIWKCGPVGDVSFTIVTRLVLPGTDWCFLDTESRPGKRDQGELEWIGLNRHIVGIAPREGRPSKFPIVLQLDHTDGRIDERGLHFVLEGENCRYAISHLSTAVLQTLNWLE